jgi:hypothetical protein
VDTHVNPQSRTTVTAAANRPNEVIDSAGSSEVDVDVGGQGGLSVRRRYASAFVDQNAISR